jgi:hypothetical protein
LKWIGQHIWDLVSRFRSDVYIESDVDAKPTVTISSGGTSQGGGHLEFVRTATGADNQNLGDIYFKGKNDADEDILYAYINGDLADASDGVEEGKLDLLVQAQGVSRTGFSCVGNGSAIVDTTIGTGATSVATVAGTLTMGSTATINNSGVIQVAAQTVIDHDQLANYAANEHFTQANITTVGTISSGTWEGTDVGVAHGGTGLSTVGTNEILTGNGTGALTSEAGLTYDSEVLTIGDDDNGVARIQRKTHSDDYGGILSIAGGASTGTDKAGGSLYLEAGVGTGTGGSGTIRIRTASADTSGSSANALDHTFQFDGEGRITTSVLGLGISEYIDFHSIDFEDSLASGNHEAGKILKYSPGADDTLTDGQIYYLHTDGTWDQADASATSTGASQLLGVGNGNARLAGVILNGFVKIPSTEILNTPGSGAVDGLPVYVSTTAGHFDFTAPSGNNEFVRVVGYAIDDDSSDVLVYFNPDRTWVKITA